MTINKSGAIINFLGLSFLENDIATCKIVITQIDKSYMGHSMGGRSMEPLERKKQATVCK